jgi:hypothetical protein
MLAREQFYKDDNVEIWIKDGIIYNIYSSGLIITEEVARSITRERIRISQGRSFPLFVDASIMQYITKPAREYWSKGDGIKYLSGGAFLIRSPVQAIFGNVFLKINKPPLPAKLFTDKKEAIQWLQQFKKPESINYRTI